jgi:hypothetical protein
MRDLTRLGQDTFDVEAYRQCLRKLSDEELIGEAEAARDMASTYAGHPPNGILLIALRECIGEWRRRYPKEMM